MMVDLAKFVGVPFQDGGRDRRGWDCWGLVRAAFADHGVDLPSYGDISAHDLMRVARQIEGDTGIDGCWIEILRTAVKPLDVAVMYRRRHPMHVGLIVEGERLLHVFEKQNTVVIPLSSRLITTFPRIRFYRHKDLTA